MTTQSNDMLRVTSKMKYDNLNDVQNVYTIQMQTGGPKTDAQTLTDLKNFLEALYNLILTSINVIVTFRELEVFNLSQDYSLGSTLFTGITAGTQAGDALPPGNAPVVIFDTAEKNVQLRKFGPPTSEASNNADGSLGTGAITAYGSYAAYLMSGQVHGGSTYRFGHRMPLTGAFITPTSYGIGSVVGYQRRRRQGRGS